MHSSRPLLADTQEVADLTNLNSADLLPKRVAWPRSDWEFLRLLMDIGEASLLDITSDSTSDIYAVPHFLCTAIKDRPNVKISSVRYV